MLDYDRLAELRDKGLTRIAGARLSNVDPGRIFNQEF